MKMLAKMTSDVDPVVASHDLGNQLVNMEEMNPVKRPKVDMMMMAPPEGDNHFSTSTIVDSKPSSSSSALSMDAAKSSFKSNHEDEDNKNYDELESSPAINEEDRHHQSADGKSAQVDQEPEMMMFGFRSLMPDAQVIHESVVGVNPVAASSAIILYIRSESGSCCSLTDDHRPDRLIPKSSSFDLKINKSSPKKSAEDADVKIDGNHVEGFRNDEQRLKIVESMNSDSGINQRTGLVTRDHHEVLLSSSGHRHDPVASTEDVFSHESSDTMIRDILVSSPTSGEKLIKLKKQINWSQSSNGCINYPRHHFPIWTVLLAMMMAVASIVHPVRAECEKHFDSIFCDLKPSTTLNFVPSSSSSSSSSSGSTNASTSSFLYSSNSVKRGFGFKGKKVWNLECVNSGEINVLRNSESDFPFGPIDSGFSDEDYYYLFQVCIFKMT